MQHSVTLIHTIAAALGLALVLGFLAARLRLPALVGYLLAGVAIGPFTPGFVADAALASQLAEIGVMLLMFGVGLHFSWGDLLAVRDAAGQAGCGRLVGHQQSEFTGDEADIGLGQAGVGQRVQHPVFDRCPGAGPIEACRIVQILAVGDGPQSQSGDQFVVDQREQFVAAVETPVGVVGLVGGQFLLAGGHLDHLDADLGRLRQSRSVLAAGERA